MKNEHDIDQLLMQYDQINKAFTVIVENPNWRKIPDYLRHPGMTTPAEFYLFASNLQIMHQNLQQVGLSQNIAIKSAQMIIGK